MPTVPNQDMRYYGSHTTAEIASITGMVSGDRVYDSTEGLEKVYDGSEWRRTPQSDIIKFTPEGGLAVLLLNKTGATSVKGALVKADTSIDMAVVLTGTDEQECVGAFYDNRIPDGELAWVVISGVAQVLLKDTTASTRGNWVKCSDTAGRADATNAAPPGGGISELDEHMREIGHALETKTGGTNVLAKIVMHFN